MASSSIATSTSPRVSAKSGQENHIQRTLEKVKRMVILVVEGRVSRLSR